MDPIEICDYHRRESLEDALLHGGVHRKSNKPLMEKRRRARINQSLMELKAALLESQKGKSSTHGSHSKWEKADILEMTVQYVQTLRNQQKSNKSDPLATGQYIAGFSECIRQCQKFFSTHGAAVTDEPHGPQASSAVNRLLFDYLLSQLRTFSNDTAPSNFAAHPQLQSPSHTSSADSPSSSMTSSADEPSGDDGSSGEPNPDSQIPRGKAIFSSSDRSAFVVPSTQTNASPILASVLNQVSPYSSFMRVALPLRSTQDGATPKMLSEAAFASAFERELKADTGAVWRPW